MKILLQHYNWLKISIVALVLIFSAFVEIKTFYHEGFFDGDSGIILDGALDIAKGEKFHLVGVGPNRYGQYTIGPALFYLYALPLVVRATPGVAQLYTIFLHIVTQLLLFLAVYKITRKNFFAGLISVCIYSFNYIVILYSSIIWNLNLIPLFLLLCILGIVYAFENKFAFIPVFIGSAIVCWQFHGVGIAAMPAVAVAFLFLFALKLRKQNQRKSLLKWTGVALGIAFLLMLPPLIDMILNNGGNLKNYFDVVSQQGGKESNGWHWLRAIGQFKQIWYSAIGNKYSEIINWFTAIGCVVSLVLWFGKRWIKIPPPRFWSVLIILGGFYIVYAKYKPLMPTEYGWSFAFMPAVIIGISYASISQIFKKFVPWNIIGIALFALIVTKIYFLHSINFQKLSSIKSQYNHHIPYNELKKIVDYIGAETCGQPFSYIHSEKWQPNGEHLRYMFRVNKLNSNVISPVNVTTRTTKPIFILRAPQAANLNYKKLDLLKRLPDVKFGKSILETFTVPDCFPMIIDVGNKKFDAYFGKGWYNNEDWGNINIVWTSKKAEIIVPAATSNLTELTICCAPFSCEIPQTNSIFLTINGTKFPTKKMKTQGFSTLKWKLSKKLLTNQLNRINLNIEKINIPAQATKNVDSRQLGVVVDWIKFQ